MTTKRRLRLRLNVSAIDFAWLVIGANGLGEVTLGMLQAARHSR